MKHWAGTLLVVFSILALPAESAIMLNTVQSYTLSVQQYFPIR